MQTCFSARDSCASLSRADLTSLVTTSFLQSLNHESIDDLQSYLIPSMGYLLCPLQLYYQHAFRRTSSRLLWSPQKYFFHSFVEPHPPSRHIQRHFEAKFIWAIGPGDAANINFAVRFCMKAAQTSAPRAGFRKCGASVQQWEFKHFNAQLFHQQHHQKNYKKNPNKKYKTQLSL